MSSSPIVVVGVAPKDPAQLSFTGDHDTVETFSPDRADQPLSVGILPWRARRRRMISYAHRAEALEECPAVDTIAITNEMAWRLMPGAWLRKNMCAKSASVAPEA